MADAFGAELSSRASYAARRAEEADHDAAVKKASLKLREEQRAASGAAATAAATGAALLVIDMQNDFCEPGAPLCVRGAAACTPQVVAAVAAARAGGVAVIWVVREHDASGCDVELSRKHLFQNGGAGVCVTGTRGAALVDALTALPGEAKVVKRRFSAFHATTLSGQLAALRCTRLVLAGVQTPNCIRATAFDALSRDIPSVVVLSDGTASATPFVQEANLYDLRCAGAEVLTTEEWAASLRPAGASGDGGASASGAPATAAS